MLTVAEVTAGDCLPPLAHHVTATTIVLGALSTRDYRPMHHDRSFAVDRNGVQDIFMNTPNQIGWFARYVSDWSGGARLGEMRLRMIQPVFAGDPMTLTGCVTAVHAPEDGLAWVELDLALTVGDLVKSTCAVAVALPVSAAVDPWDRRGDQWRPFQTRE